MKTKTQKIKSIVGSVNNDKEHLQFIAKINKNFFGTKSIHAKTTLLDFTNKDEIKITEINHFNEL